MTPDPASPLIFELTYGVAHIRFNRPEALNAFDVPMAQAFYEACQRLQGVAGLRAIVLSGQGKAFMAGGVASFHADLPGAAATAERMLTPLHAGLSLLAAMPQPVIGSLHGVVIGAGVSMALACDLAIAADNTRFVLASSRVGASLDAGCSWALPRIVGLRKAMELALLADPLDAQEALRLGLVNRVVPLAMLGKEVDELALRLASGPTAAYGRIKCLLRASSATPLDQQLDAERAAFCESAASADFAEGLNAFFEKRPANFRGS